MFVNPTHKKFFLLMVGACALTIFVSCGNKSRKDMRFSSQQDLSYGPLGAMIDPRESKTFLDYDKDGLPDRFDDDIDNDGFSNLIDKFPFNETKHGDDSDYDGLPDFVDFDFTNPTFAEAQKRLFQMKKIAVVNGDGSFLDDQLVILFHALNSTTFSWIDNKHLKVVVAQSQEQRSNLNRSEFDPFWKFIAFYPSDRDAQSSFWSCSLYHEFGHVYALAYPHKFSQFEKLLLEKKVVAPSLYAQSNSSEAFAESYLFHLVEKNNDLCQDNRFENSFIDTTESILLEEIFNFQQY